MKRLRRPSPAMTVALVALFVAMSGAGYAAFNLPKNSVGSKQLKANAVRSSKVKDGSLLAGDFRAGQLPAGPAGERGPQGIQGDKGEPCPPSDASCKGPKGDTGQRGPGTLTFDGQFARDDTYHEITTLENMIVQIYCGGPSGDVVLAIDRADISTGLYGWGTRWTGTQLQRAVAEGNVAGLTTTIQSHGNGAAELDVVARSALAGQVPKYTHFDLDAVLGTKCNYHALIIPPS
jgi:hypothetical protein